MGYRDNLWRMLQPLGVYSEGGFGDGALEALGAALDQVEERLDLCLKESLVMSAEGTGLSDAEQIFPMVAGTETDGRREALQKLWQTDNLSCTNQGIVKTLAGCGIAATVGTTEACTALVVLTEEVTIWDEPVWMFWILEQLIPCHLRTYVRFQYVNVSTGESVTERIPLPELRKRTQKDWEDLLGAYK